MASYVTMPSTISAQSKDPTSRSNANEGNTRLINYNVYEGVVTEVDYLSKKLTVCVNNTSIRNCVYAANAIAGLLGFSSSQLPQAGDVVLCLYTSQITWIIGTQPLYRRNITKYAGDITGVNDYSQIADKNLAIKHDTDVQVNPGYPMSRDLLPGEEELTNNTGIALRLLTNFAQLDAGGIAKIECHLLNDLVRIVDNNFAHHSCGGDTFIWSNGRNNYEDHFTPYPHEAAGKLSEDEPYAKLNDTFKQQDVYEFSGQSAISDTGRWRKSTYIGFLGDMLHFWITHPVDVISNYAQQSARASRFKTWVGSDGTLVVQAAGDIVMEVTQHMAIPEIHYKWDDPAYDPDKILQELDIEYLKIWGEGEKHWEDMQVACWQMRNYLKYLTVWHSLQRFRQLANPKSGQPYCTIKPEAENPVGNINCGETDKLQANGEVTGTETKAGTCMLHMCPDGSVTLLSGNSTSCIMNNGNLQLVAPYNIEIKAGNTFSVTARDVSVKAFRNVELVSLMGAFYIKAKTALKALCEAGRIWLKSDAPIKNAPELMQGEPELNKYSIVLDASQGEVLVHGNKGVTVGADGDGSKVTIQAEGSNGCVDIASKGLIRMYSRLGTYIRTKLLGIYSTLTSIYGQRFNIFNKFEFNPGSAQFDANVVCRYFSTPTVLYARMFQSYNQEHLAVTREDLREERQASATPNIVADNATIDYINSDVTSKSLTINYNDKEFKNGKDKWAFFKWEVDNESVTSCMSLKADPWADTFINCSGNLQTSFKSSYVDLQWDSNEVKLSRAPRTDSSRAPWPGAEAKFFVFKSEGQENIPVGEKWDKDFTKDDICSVSDMKPFPVTYRFFNRPNNTDPNKTE